MIILGIDPGSRVTGFGVVDYNANRYQYLGSGCIRTSTDDLPGRLAVIFDGVSSIIEDYKPEEFAIEQVFMACLLYTSPSPRD